MSEIVNSTLAVAPPRPVVWWKALRAYSLPASLVPTIFGVVYVGAAGGAVPWWAFPVVLLGGVLLHLGTNLTNDAVDFEQGVDTAETLGGSGVLVAGWLTPQQVRLAAYLCFALAALLGGALVWLRGWPLLAIGLAGLLGGYFYTAPPLKLKYRGLGEPLVFLMMGPLMVAGAALAATGTIPPPLWAASIPIGLLVTAILCINNLRDLDDDRQRGVLTLSNLLGWKLGRAEFLLLLWGAYLSLPLLVWLNVLPLWTLLALLSIPLALGLSRAVLRAEEGELPPGIVERTAQLHLLFGALLIAGTLLHWLLSG